MSILTFFSSLILGATFFLGVLGGPIGATLTIVWTWTLILSLASAINNWNPRRFTYANKRGRGAKSLTRDPRDATLCARPILHRVRSNTPL